MALFQFLFSWNDFIGPLIYLNDQSKFTLALGLANMQSAIGLSDFGMIMAAAVFTVAPVMLLFIFTQRYFIEGIVRSEHLRLTTDWNLVRALDARKMKSKIARSLGPEIKGLLIHQSLDRRSTLVLSLSIYRFALLQFS